MMRSISTARFFARVSPAALWRVALLPLLATAIGAREVRPFDTGWTFHLGDLPNERAAELNANTWTRLDLPHDWSIGLPVEHQAPATGAGGFFPTGVGWYCHRFTAAPEWRGQRVTIEFDGAYQDSEVWLNGNELGRHPYGYTPFRYELTPRLRWNEPNVLLVRVDNSVQPNSRWYSGSGIYRHVRLVVTAPLHFATDGIVVNTSVLSDSSATLQVTAALRDDGPAGEDGRHATVETTVVDPVGSEVAIKRTEVEMFPGQETTASAMLVVTRPRPWSPVTPLLYRAITRLVFSARVVDEVTTAFGIRTVRVSAERGFELNGHPIKLVGGNVHHDNGVLGAAAFDRAEVRRVALMKAAGFNAIRTAHNPPSPAFLDACDRLGMLVIDEAFDVWEKHKMAQDYARFFRDWWKRDLDAMVLRDRNHPSVVMWSIGNEIPERASAEGLQTARALAARIRELDATRPITSGVNGPGRNGDWTRFDPLFATLDVAGYNYELGRHAADHARVPSRVIVVTESYQSETFANWATAHDNPYVIGDFVWSGIDYLGEAGIGRVFPPGEKVVKHWEGDQWPWHGAACGDIDLTGWRKPISHYRAIVWDRGEKLYATVRVPTPNHQPWGVSPWTVETTLPSWTWPGEEGKTVTVEVYSRYPTVRLYLNDRMLGEKPTGREQEFRAEFAVPYAAGVLKAVGVEQGREREAFTLTTASVARRIRLAPDQSVIRADGEDLSFITVEVTDSQGRWVPTADGALRFSVSGPATIAAIGNADLTSMETYRTNPHHAYQGRLLLVLRSTHDSGTVAVTATGDGLEKATTRLQTSKSR